MIKLAVNGACGRMGLRIVALAQESGLFELVGAIESPGHPSAGVDIGVLASIGELGVVVSETPRETPQVVIDFTVPAGVERCAQYCVASKVALVTGTTGMSEELVAKLAQAAHDVPVLIGSNMSLGMNLLFKLVGQVAAQLGEDYDIEIAETHHRFKRDAPSGTALSLARAVAEGMNWPYPDCLRHGREGKESLRQDKTIGMHALRVGDTVGEHSVHFGALGETVTISHSAHTRDTFVRGALRAATWIVDKPAGMYGMDDVLGL